MKIDCRTHYLRCGSSLESAKHALFWCCFAMEVWEHFEYWDLMKKFDGMGYFDLIRWIFGKVKKKVFELFYVILCGSWNERDGFVHASNVDSAVVIFEKAAVYMRGPAILIIDDIKAALFESF
ncbi:hypothetical protein Dsin_008698 [Dipteronia sinensis]|uniref:Reverse transcriptase zinc-binding domain-containing protein n=1 Tax=Dipteronia sinensis TaxID=43782 RepID=A0AAE0APN7_9ROSI|nr:hypothetical protein Dsin_008698 [Dipteronia sinensis]